ncbi:MAG: hypothetical protein NVS1B12_11320 [Acidimicrobiales bacterium]
MTTTDTRYQLDPEGARFEAYLAELFDLEPLTDAERAELRDTVEAARRQIILP